MARKRDNYEVVSLDYYSDDPVDFQPVKSKSFLANKFYGISILVGLLFFGQTLASNISLGTNQSIQFGQGLTLAAACDNSITITPYSSFVNSSGGGSYYFSSFKLSGINMSACNGVTFTIKAYDSTTAVPLTLFGTATAASIKDTNSVFTMVPGQSGLNLTDTSTIGAFTATFTSPSALSSNIYKITLESSGDMNYSNYAIGDTGPGGGIIYYISSPGFNCGPSYSSTGSPSGGLCHYLEMAPANWSGGSDPTYPWATVNTSTYLNLYPGDIGRGYSNSLAIINAGNGSGSAAYVARNYQGGGYSDWFLPAGSELNELINYAKAAPYSATSPGFGISGITTSPTYGYYWAANDYGVNASNSPELARIWGTYWGGGGAAKSGSQFVRPVRAF